MPLDNISLTATNGGAHITLKVAPISNSTSYMSTSLSRSEAKQLANQLAKLADFQPAPTSGVLIHRRHHTAAIHAWRNGTIDWAEALSRCQVYRLFWLCPTGVLYDVCKRTGKLAISDMLLAHFLISHMDTAEADPFVTTHLT